MKSLLLIPAFFLVACGSTITASYPVGQDGKAFVALSGDSVSIGYKGRLPWPPANGKTVIPAKVVPAEPSTWDKIKYFFGSK
jgi:hypothetical protein